MRSVGAAVVAFLIVLRTGATTETTTETTAVRCTPVSDCYGEWCEVDYTTFECPSCICWEPNCVKKKCEPGEECILSTECPDPYYDCMFWPICVPIGLTGASTETTTFTTTTESSPRTTFSECPPIYGCEGEYCEVQHNSGECPVCLCWDPICMFNPCRPGEICIQIDQDPFYSCISEGTTITTTTPGPTTTSECPIPPCAVGCRLVPTSDGCFGCSCPDRTCEETTCEPGQECVMKNDDCPIDVECFLWPTCVPITETTTSCPLIKCAPGCVTITGPDECPSCACPPSCQTVKCSAGHECQLVNVPCNKDPCFPEAHCVPVKVTTTACPEIKCDPGCKSEENGLGGCPTCVCPPCCEGFNCSDGYECRLVEVECAQDPCYPEPECQPIS